MPRAIQCSIMSRTALSPAQVRRPRPMVKSCGDGWQRG